MRYLFSILCSFAACSAQNLRSSEAIPTGVDNAPEVIEYINFDPSQITYPFDASELSPEELADRDLSFRQSMFMPSYYPPVGYFNDMRFAANYGGHGRSASLGYGGVGGVRRPYWRRLSDVAGESPSDAVADEVLAPENERDLFYYYTHFAPYYAQPPIFYHPPIVTYIPVYYVPVPLNVTSNVSYSNSTTTSEAKEKESTETTTPTPSTNTTEIIAPSVTEPVASASSMNATATEITVSSASESSADAEADTPEN
eukprot:GDKJ01000785.1.p1 GENE.GDKJ01000785.1~~GDKJ01000785.1.p1  ORF type:complete len:256 (+),score=60.20 GDKJ01000785.1:66-833(+)